MTLFSAASGRLAGKTVLITGASSGIGAATAVLFGCAGAKVVLTARREKELNEVVEKVKAAGAPFAQGIVLDMADKDALAAVLSKLAEPVKNVDILVNNAGFASNVDKVGDVPDDEVEAMFKTNVLGLIQLTQIFVRDFKARKAAGHIIQLGSVAGIEAYPGSSIYCASKFAVTAFTTALRKELIATPIRVSEIQPGRVETNFATHLFKGDQAQAAVASMYQDIEPLTPEDLAEEIVWTASRPPHVNIATSLVFPTAQAGMSYIHKGTLGFD